jgi:DNA repair exonuclease SbcCD nuclease subunit
MVTRLPHSNDTHPGNRQEGRDVERDDLASAFERAIDYATDEDVQAVAHGCDSIEARDPHLPDLNRRIESSQGRADADVPFYGVAGDHEREATARDVRDRARRRKRRFARGEGRPERTPNEIRSP